MREIYEGDIILIKKHWAYKNNSKHLVEHISQYNCSVFLPFSDSDWEIDSPVEIIGNIYENPELLNKEEK